jgi:hypothetical protein
MARPARKPAFIFLLLVGLGRASAFLPSATKISLPDRSTTTAGPNKLHLSLEDSWSDIAARLPKTLDSSPSFEQLTEQFVAFPTDITINVEWLSIAATFAAKQAQLFEQLPLVGQFGVVATPIFLLTFGIVYNLSFPPEDYRKGVEPYARGNYDPIQSKAYYAKNPKVPLQRSLQLFRLSNRFIVGLLLDKYIFRNEEKMKPQRARELLKLITQLGPTAIKVGQALSVRSDIISAEYAEALSTLQDRVPPFSNVDAKRLLQQELGPERYEQLEGITNASPVASASIGQVYKTTIDGREVAVKVRIAKLMRL